MNTEQKDQYTYDPKEQQRSEGAAAAETEASEAETAEAAEAQSAAEAGQADAGESVEVDALRQELEQAKKQADENYQRYVRTQADFDNFRKRTQKEREEFAQYASAKLLEQLLPVIDNFERAIAASKDGKDYDALAKGVDMIFRQFVQVLESEGLKAMETVGQPFNPDYHQAVMQVESEEHEEGTIVEELQKGYTLKDRVLRPAMVKVSS
ncbi:nucleotide exchange factor GrpE [Paenibacillus ginsengihumi]|uniref:nucleotide exchange factor GrpE n=1 Tax=Paenibacillus ginsengihumi TaxID=431596 RepID=UPI000371F19C|nr:nucleotide exchange factor GrpE [Paenibacillus ginsengihumi]